MQEQEKKEDERPWLKSESQPKTDFLVWGSLKASFADLKDIGPKI
jgi:hypothetical protein